MQLMMMTMPVLILLTLTLSLPSLHVTHFSPHSSTHTQTHSLAIPKPVPKDQAPAYLLRDTTAAPRRFPYLPTHFASNKLQTRTASATDGRRRLLLLRTTTPPQHMINPSLPNPDLPPSHPLPGNLNPPFPFLFSSPSLSFATGPPPPGANKQQRIPRAQYDLPPTRNAIQLCRLNVCALRANLMESFIHSLTLNDEVADRRGARPWLRIRGKGPMKFGARVGDFGFV